MCRSSILVITFLLACFTASVEAVEAQEQPETPSSDLITKSVKAVGYTVKGGSTKVDFRGTELMPEATGEAKVEAKTGATSIDIALKKLTQPSALGAEFLTYVLWVVTPDGRSGNTGEILINKNGEGRLHATTPAQTFSMIVTAEPYFAVHVPSEMIVLENDTRQDTKGQIFPINDFKLMKRAQYEKLGNPLAMTPDLERVPLQMYEARNAVEIARSRGAEKDAPEIFSKATESLQIAENALASKADKKDIMSKARQTVQFAEDARALAAQRQEQARIAAEKDAAAAKARAEAEAKAAQEAQRQAELAAAKQAQLEAEAEAMKAREEAAKAEAEGNRRAAEDLRNQLLEQFNRILPTTDTERGLKVKMGDVLFDMGKYNLRPPAREALAKLSGIVLAHPGLQLTVEGYTDSVGSDAFNDLLSEQRALAVRAYLVGEGLSESTVAAQGLGKAMPIASNDTPQGRQQNRRVEIIVSGEVIGARIGLSSKRM
jgi:outer membrane protein OmpA-like peptidoglycan-associated protein